MEHSVEGRLVVATEHGDVRTTRNYRFLTGSFEGDDVAIGAA